MILAIPAIGVLKILLPHTDHLKPFVILLEDKVPVKEKESEVLPDKFAEKIEEQIKAESKKQKAES